MRLIDCSTLTLHSVEISQAPSYVVLSHTWTDDEVLFEDMRDLFVRQNREGWGKIETTCQRANIAGLRFAWVDTCCIDKSSSAELSENINSMFKIYRQASVCYAYLADFKVPVGYRAHPGQPPPDITGCRWFERGWTLQELIAPPDLLFFDRDWTLVGTRGELSDQISRRTNIPRRMLKAHSISLMRFLLNSCSIALRMSWAAGRTTARPEDMAYSLLGIFDISMPMLYGEGYRAFRRLQEELMKESNDVSIFAWQTSRDPPMRDSSVPNSVYSSSPRGVLAQQPADFANGHKLVPSAYHESTAEFTMTNKGLRIETTLKEICPGLYFMPLHHKWGPLTGESSTASESVGICLESRADGTYARAYPERLLVPSHEHFDAEERHTTARFIHDKLYLVKDIGLTRVNMINSPNERLRISTTAIDASMLRVVAREPMSLWDSAAELFVIRGLAGLKRFAVYQHMIYTDKTGLVCDLLLVCGIELGGTCWACLTSAKENPTLYNAAKLLDLEATYSLASQSGSEIVLPDGMVGLCASVNEALVYEHDYTIFEVALKYQ